MASFSLTHQILGTSPVIQVGETETPTTISFTNGVIFSVVNTIVADNFSQATLWTTGDGNVTTFQFGLLLSDADVFVQLQNDDAGANEYAVIFVPANLPFYFGPLIGASTSDRLDGADLISGTDYDDVSGIQVQRDVADAVGDATVSLYLFR